MTKLNQVKKVKAEELSKAAAAGSKDAAKKLKKLEKKIRVSLPGFQTVFIFLLRAGAHTPHKREVPLLPTVNNH